MFFLPLEQAHTDNSIGNGYIGQKLMIKGKQKVKILLFGALFALVSLCAPLMVSAAALPGGSVYKNDGSLENIGAEAYIVVDAKTGQVLLEHNADKEMYPASITKILTLGLSLEAKGGLDAARDNEIEMTYEAAHSLIPGAASVALTENEILRFEDLVFATSICSANEAAYMLAQYIGGGSKDSFVDMMNSKAEELGLSSTHFANPSGLPDDEHYTSAYDMAQITRWALNIQGFREAFGATVYTMEPTNKQSQQRVFNTSNLMLIPSSSSYYQGIVGSKTGRTTDAGYTLATVAERNGIELICIVLKCSSSSERINSTHALLDYCFDNYSLVEYPADKIENLTVPVFSGGTDSIGNITVCPPADEPIKFLLHNSMSIDDVQLSCSVPEKYVIGLPFEPVLSLSLGNPSPFQRQQLTGGGMKWYGLEEIFAAQEKSGGGAGAGAQSSTARTVFMAIGGFFALMFALVFSRAVYVKHRRKKRRQARLAAARAYIPVSYGSRPEPPQRQLYSPGAGSGRYVQVYSPPNRQLSVARGGKGPLKRKSQTGRAGR